MRKTILLLIIFFAFTLSGCRLQSSVNKKAKNGNGTIAVNLPEDGEQTKETPSANEDIIEIKEKMFITQTNDIYYNAAEYLGKTIKYEGVFIVFESSETGMTYYSVIRYGPGCCGDDGNAGFEVTWDKDYPQHDDWVEVIGVLEEYEENGYKYLRLRLSSLTVLPVRGTEYVTQ